MRGVCRRFGNGAAPFLPPSSCSHRPFNQVDALLRSALILQLQPAMELPGGVMQALLGGGASALIGLVAVALILLLVLVKAFSGGVPSLDVSLDSGEAISCRHCPQPATPLPPTHHLDMAQGMSPRASSTPRRRPRGPFHAMIRAAWSCWATPRP